MNVAIFSWFSCEAVVWKGFTVIGWCERGSVLVVEVGVYCSRFSCGDSH